MFENFENFEPYEFYDNDLDERGRQEAWEDNMAEMAELDHYEKLTYNEDRFLESDREELDYESHERW